MIGKFAQSIIYEGLNTLCYAMLVAKLGIEEKPTHTWYMRWCMWKQRRRISPPHPPPSPTREATSKAYSPWTLVSRRKDEPSKSRPHPGP